MARLVAHPISSKRRVIREPRARDTQLKCAELYTRAPNETISECERSREEAASITPLIWIYFLIVMSLIFVAADTTSTYIARRQLINEAEDAIAKGVQEIDDIAYYDGIPRSFTSPFDSYTRERRVPIDCSAAERSIRFSLNPDISIHSIRCDGYEIQIEGSRVHQLPFPFFRFGISEFTNRVTVGGSSNYKP